MDAKVIEGYRLVTSAANVTGVFKDTTQEVLNVNLGETYSAVVKDFDGYTVKTIPTNVVRALTGNRVDLILVDGTDFPDGITIT
ncbi:MucBP domain-containing protein [Metaclostridioides mangenotii]|uniref:MucBP domain-containing protein n=1 Tax=Metaclostridioides mangenotii TaxID=1540 RepID=UPI000480D410|nr:MucBP domain-containing protein [Clostridioides mangenotii]